MRSVKSHQVLSGRNAASNRRGAKFVKSDISPKIPTAAPETVDETGLNQLKPAKRSRDRIPPPQQERIRQKFIAGKGIAEISREEGRNRETVAKIVRSPEMREYTLRMRERFFGLEESAVETVRHAVEQEKNAQVAYKILSDCGVIPTPAERMQIFEEQKTPKDREESVYRIMANLHTIAFERSRAYGMDMSDIEPTLAKAGGRFDQNGNVVPLQSPDQPLESTSNRNPGSEKRSNKSSRGVKE